MNSELMAAREEIARLREAKAEAENHVEKQRLMLGDEQKRNEDLRVENALLRAGMWKAINSIVCNDWRMAIRLLENALVGKKEEA